MKQNYFKAEQEKLCIKMSLPLESVSNTPRFSVQCASAFVLIRSP